MTPVAAETLGLKALTWLVGQPELLDRFLTVSGLNGSGLRARAGDASLLGAILEHILANEQLAKALCTDEGLEPRELHLARHVLEST
jgi:hypothetical protein